MQFFKNFLFALPLVALLGAPIAASAATASADSPVTVSTSARASGVHRIGNDNGGSVVGYAQAVSRLRQQDTLIVFDGRCASACTLYLSLQSTRTCLMPGSSFLFHRAYGARPELNHWATQFMLSQYPTWVRSWIQRQGGLTDRILRMDYRYAARFMRTCRAAST